MTKITTLIISLLSCCAAHAQQATFKANNHFSQIKAAQQMVAADMNADRLPDLVVASNHEAGVLIYLNQGSNTFLPATRQPNTGPVSDVVVADFDADGDQDLWVGSEAINNPTMYQTLFFNDGEGRFKAAQSDTQRISEPGLDQLLTGDINNDGLVDVVRADQYNRTVYIYLNQGGGTFDERVFDQDLDHVGLADFDGDGFLDIWSIYDDLTVYFNNQNGEFSATEKTQVALGVLYYLEPFTYGAENILYADIDADGDTDIQIFSQGRHLSRLMNQGDGTFEGSGGLLYLGGRPGKQNGVLLDLNNDGLLDLYYGTKRRDLNSALVVSNSEGGLDFGAEEIGLQEASVEHFVAADFDLDGDLDLASIGSEGLNVWVQQETLTFQAQQQTAINYSWNGSTHSHFGDSNHDGFHDYFLGGPDGIQLALGNGRGSFASFNQISNETMFRFKVADFNGDDFIDVAYINYSGAYLLINNQDGTFTKQTISDTLNLAYSISTGDFDSDGDVDVVVMERLHSVHVYLNNGTAAFDDTTTIHGGFAIAELIDLDQTGQLQLLTNNYFTNRGEPTRGVIVYEMVAGEVVKRSSYDISISPSYKSLVTFDYDLDGDLDIMTANLVDDGLFQIIKNQQSTLESDRFFLSNPYPELAVDLNQDGRVDFITSSGQATLMDDGNGSYDRMELVTSESAFNRLTLFDIDEDGDQDLAVNDVLNGATVFMNTTIDQDFTGQWYNAIQSGHGLQVEEVISNGIPQVNLSWYVFDQGQPIWLTGVGPIENNTASIPVGITSGPEFGAAFSSEDVQLSYWGDLKLTLHDLQSMTLEWNGSPGGFGQGSMELSRLSVIKPVKATTQSINSCHTGSWYNSTENGHGFMAQVVEVAGQEAMVLTWFTYLEGQQYWIYAQGPIDGKQAKLQAQAGSGGMFPPAFVSADVNFDLWGEIDFELLGDDKAKITWRPVLPGFEPGSLTVGRLSYIDRYRCP